MSSGQVFQQREGIQVAGNATFENVNLYNQKRPFTDLKAEDLVSAHERLISPGARQLIRQLAHLRLLVLAPVELDGQAIARQLAAGLYSNLRQEGNDDLKVRDWSTDGGLIDFDVLLEGEETKILILGGAGPNNLGFNLDRLARLLGERQHYAIITTELDLNLWHPNASECAFYIRPSWDSYYGSEFLCELLRKELAQVLTDGQSIGNAQDPAAGVESTQCLLAGVEPAWIIAKLREPDRLFDFVKALQREVTPPTAERIKALAEEESGDRSKALRWYRDQNERLQLLAVGLMLFEGLPADQVFAGLETLVDGVWRPDKPALQGFDYLDVEQLGRYFKRMQDAGEEGRIVITAQREIFDAAWQLHRRSILAALPAMAKMLRNAGMGLEALDVDPEKLARTSAATPPAAAPPGAPAAPQEVGQTAAQGQGSQRSSDDAADRRLVWRMSQGRARELYGSARRMAGLQGAVVASLNKIGQLSGSAFAAVEPCLRELAADESELVRVVVGRTLAATRDWPGQPGEENPLFSMLQDWWRDSCFGEEAPPKVRRERNATRSTIALAVGHAANYDSANGMNGKLLALLESILQDYWPEVRTAIWNVLPWIVTKHLRQLEQKALVRAVVAPQEDLLVGAAIGTAGAYRLRPEETGEILSHWCALARGPRDAAAAAQVPEQEMLMALAGRALGALKIRDNDPVFPPSRIFEELSAILRVSRRPLVRRHILIAIGEQALRFYDHAAPLVVKLLAEVSLEDRSILVNFFIRAYLIQRQQLAGGEETLHLGEDVYPIWISQDRPLTQIEEAAYLWLQEWDLPVAQQVAAEIFAALAATTLERHERQLIADRRKLSGRHDFISSGRPEPVSFNPVRPVGTLGRLALRLTIRDRELRAALWAPFAELLWISRQARAQASQAAQPVIVAGKVVLPLGGTPALGSAPTLAPTSDVLQRWRAAAANESLKDMVDCLDKALAAYPWCGPLVAIVIFLLIVSCFQILNR